MKAFITMLLFLICSVCNAQLWFAEVMAGASSYNGDLTQKELSLNRMGPAFSLNIKYNTGDFVNLRAGLSYATLSGNDKYNKDPGLKSRGLSFKTSVVELNFCAEVNVFDPQIYYAYPYIFGGIGVFHFNPYTYDNAGNKNFLQPLGTEGQDLDQYAKRSKYSLYQLCFPVGGGFKLNLSDKWEVGFEFGYRILVTDYLDDVSKTYVNLNLLEQERGAKAAELSYRKKEPFNEENESRGNAAISDSYFFTGIKIATIIGWGKENRSK